MIYISTLEFEAYRIGSKEPLPSWIAQAISDGVLMYEADTNALVLVTAQCYVPTGSWLVRGPSGDIQTCSDATFQSLYTPRYGEYHCGHPEVLSETAFNALLEQSWKLIPQRANSDVIETRDFASAVAPDGELKGSATLSRLLTGEEVSELRKFMKGWGGESFTISHTLTREQAIALINDGSSFSKRALLYGEVDNECDAQDAKWGGQNHPSVADSVPADMMTDAYGVPSRRQAKRNVQLEIEGGTLTWADIAIEELAEALEAKDDAERRGELVQLAAVFVRWIACIDRRAAKQAQEHAK